MLRIATSTGRRQLPGGNPGPLAWGQQGSVPLGVSWDLWLLPGHGLSPRLLVLEKHMKSGVFGARLWFQHADCSTSTSNVLLLGTATPSPSHLSTGMEGPLVCAECVVFFFFLICIIVVPGAGPMRQKSS